MTRFRHFPIVAGMLVFLVAAAPARPQAAGPATHPTTRSVPSTQPVPFLTADEAIGTMNLPPGLKMQVVAEEPMVQHPVVIQFDPDGRIWVVEMRAYMLNPFGHGETEPTGRISVLEDLDGDGRADRSTVFLDGLVLPRAVQVVRDGVLVATPPNLLFYRDADRDLKPDGEPTVVAIDYGIGKWNPEHQPNGLLHGVDNWIYSAGYGKRIKSLATPDKWLLDAVPEMGQWGISHDDRGRLFHNSNSDHLRASFYAPHYAGRNPHRREPAGANVRLAATQAVFPAHYTAVNRGYREGQLRPDMTLATFTAACAPVVYRDALLGPEFAGNVFVCEPSGNVIRRSVLIEGPEGTFTGRNAYDNEEFIASTYERFRPVNLATGPDGALYVVDMHHGLLQHRNFLTTYGRAQYLARRLDKHLLTGRIYRIVPEDFTGPTPRPSLSTTKSLELIELLGHANGWVRDTAQRLLVERAEYRLAGRVRKQFAEGNALGRLHALWVLEGWGVLDPKTVLAALADEDPAVRAAGIRTSERLLTTEGGKAAILPELLKLVGDEDGSVRLQFALTVSPLGTPESEVALADLAFDAETDVLRDAILTGLRGREVAFLERLLASPAWRTERTGPRAMMLSMLASCVVNERKPEHLSRLLDLAAQQPPAMAWRQVALLDGFPAPPKNSRGRPPKGIMLAEAPPALPALQASANEAVQDRLSRVTNLLHWPGQPGYVAPPPVRPLTAEEASRFEDGRRVYNLICVQCHKPDGQGQAGLAPPLADSEWVLGAESRLVRIVTGGLTGPITVNGQSWSLDMPGLPTLTDDEVANVLTYVRREWDHTADPVTTEFVQKVRAENGAKTGAWTERELLSVD